jgi:hypothetical protein
MNRAGTRQRKWDTDFLLQRTDPSFPIKELSTRSWLGSRKKLAPPPENGKAPAGIRGWKENGFLGKAFSFTAG